MNANIFKTDELSIVVGHAAIIVISFAAALWLRLDFFLSDFKTHFLLVGLAITLPVKLATFAAGGLYKGHWRYTGLAELYRISIVNVAASALSAFGIMVWIGTAFSRSVYVVDFLLCVVLCVSMRFAAQLSGGLFTSLFTDRERETARELYPHWIATLFLMLASFLLAVTAVLGASVYKLATRLPRLEDLSVSERQRLVQLASQVVPPVYQPFPLAGPVSFYHMAPNTHYTNVLDDTFTTNDLGFRTVETTPKPSGVKRIVVVGDSWAFGQGVHYEETFANRLQTMLNRKGVAWQVYDLAMPGWNTGNEVAALHTFFSRLQPDFVVFCPTSNDIDDSYDVWNGRLILNGFSSGAGFRNSYDYQSRWIHAFQTYQNEVDWLSKREGVPSLVYFLAEWRKLAPYYAALSGFHSAYTVVPTEYVAEKYRLPNQHANPEGHRLIASYLYNALLEQQLVWELDPVAITQPVVFPGSAVVDADVQKEFESFTQYFRQLDRTHAAEEFMGMEELFSLEAPAGTATVNVELALIDDAGLYPLRVEVGLRSPEDTPIVTVFDRFVAGPQVVTLRKPASLNRYSTLEIRVAANRTVVGPQGLTPISMKRPRVRIG